MESTCFYLMHVMQGASEENMRKNLTNIVILEV